MKELLIESAPIGFTFAQSVLSEFIQTMDTVNAVMFVDELRDAGWVERAMARFGEVPLEGQVFSHLASGEGHAPQGKRWAEATVYSQMSKMQSYVHVQGRS